MKVTLWQRLTRRLALLFSGEAGQQDTQRIMEAIIPIASLYGVDMGNIETEWFRNNRVVS